nr:triple gene block protein 2 [Peach chlorotic mottle virus]
MPLAQPPDFSKSVFPLAIGLAVGVVIFALTRSTLPHTGDNIHHLPHGGNYVDGTKKISYCGPKESFPTPGILGLKFYAFCLACCILAYLHAAFRVNNSSFRCPTCINNPQHCVRN